MSSMSENVTGACLLSNSLLRATLNYLMMVINNIPYKLLLKMFGSIVFNARRYHSRYLVRTFGRLVIFIARHCREIVAGPKQHQAQVIITDWLQLQHGRICIATACCNLPYASAVQMFICIV